MNIQAVVTPARAASALPLSQNALREK